MTSDPTGSMVQRVVTRQTLTVALAMAAAFAAGCTGTIRDSASAAADPGSGGTHNGTTTGSGGTTTGSGGSTVACGAVDPGRVTIHRLNNLEFNNTVRDLLGDTTQPAAKFPPDTGGANFDNNADVLGMNPLLFEGLESATDTLANAAVASGSATLAKIVNCDPTKVGDSTCATTVMTAFARRAWRRPPTSDEIARLIAFVPLAKSNGDGFNQGIALAIKATLLSPNFMFRPELDPNPNATSPRLLNSYEVASRLSYFLWSSMPDDALAAAADANQLQDVASVQQQATRMLADPKASQLVTTMGGEWFGTYKMANVAPLPASFSSYDPALGAAMTQETTLFLNDFFTGTASFLDALDAPWTYANARLAQHYGLSGVSGSGFQKVSLAGTQRQGLLMQGSMLTTTSFPTRTSPVKRGQWVLANILCTPPPSPPDNVPPLDQTVVPPGSSQRVHLEAHIANPACATCHKLMDPLGFALEHFDGIGHWRDMDGTASIDATGQLPSGQKFDGALQMVAGLKQQASTISDCVSQKMFAYSLGRDPGAADKCQLNALSSQFAAANYNLRSLIMQMVASDTFRMRRPVAPGGI
ncbi:MAG: DUF1592 domain-containing protein [Polyangia bacterium]